MYIKLSGFLFSENCLAEFHLAEIFFLAKVSTAGLL